jgi:type IV secretory pathway VirB10-like protein
MKKITGLTLILFLTLSVFQVSAQGRPGATKVEDKAEETTVAKPASDSDSVQEVKAGSEAVEADIVAPTPRPRTKTENAEPVSPAPRPKTQTENPGTITPVMQSEQPVKGPSREKRMHAEQKSNGNAFSGKGKGSDKNLVDPEAKDKKLKMKNKKKDNKK